MGTIGISETTNSSCSLYHFLGWQLYPTSHVSLMSLLSEKCDKRNSNSIWATTLVDWLKALISIHSDSHHCIIGLGDPHSDYMWQSHVLLVDGKVVSLKNLQLLPNFLELAKLKMCQIILAGCKTQIQKWKLRRVKISACDNYDRQAYTCIYTQEMSMPARGPLEVEIQSTHQLISNWYWLHN